MRANAHRPITQARICVITPACQPFCDLACVQSYTVKQMSGLHRWEHAKSILLSKGQIDQQKFEWVMET